MKFAGLTWEEIDDYCALLDEKPEGYDRDAEKNQEIGDEFLNPD